MKKIYCSPTTWWWYPLVVSFHSKFLTKRFFYLDLWPRIMNPKFFFTLFQFNIRNFNRITHTIHNKYLSMMNYLGIHLAFCVRIFTNISWYGEIIFTSDHISKICQLLSAQHKESVSHFRLDKVHIKICILLLWYKIRVQWYSYLKIPYLSQFMGHNTIQSYKYKNIYMKYLF